MLAMVGPIWEILREVTIIRVQSQALTHLMMVNGRCLLYVVPLESVPGEDEEDLFPFVENPW